MPTPREALARTLEHFGPLSEACLEALMERAIPRRLDKGAYFARAGQSSRSLGFILDGVFRAFPTTDNGTEYNKTFFGTGTFIVALASLVSGQTNRIDIQALTPADLLVFDF